MQEMSCPQKPAIFSTLHCCLNSVSLTDKPREKYDGSETEEQFVQMTAKVQQHFCGFVVLCLLLIVSSEEKPKYHPKVRILLNQIIAADVDGHGDPNIMFSYVL